MTHRTKTTMKDVAKLAGVSISTVSSVVNDRVPVSPARKKRVLDAMATLDFHPDAIARGLKTGRTNVIGVIVPDITNAFYPEVIRGVEDAARKAGYSVLLCDSNEQGANESQHLSSLFSRRVDGVLVACCVDSSSYLQSSRWACPIVFLDRLPPVSVSSTVSTDNLQAGTIATRYLIGLGHKNIAMLAGHLGLSPHRDRLEGFRKAMQEANLPIRDEYLITGDIQTAEALASCRQLLQLAMPPTAIMVSNNKLLLGVLQALDELKVNVPEQVSLLGFDDYIWNRYFNPSLTAIAQSTMEMGKAACELLLSTICNTEEASEVQHLRLPATLCVRSSTSAPRS